VERNEFEAAESHLARANELGRRSGRLDAVRNSAPALTRLRLARGDASGALAAVDEAEAAFGEPRSALARAEMLAHRARVLVRQGSLNDAARCADEASRLVGRDRGQTGELVALAAVRAQVARSRPGEAVAVLTHALAAAERDGRLGSAIELRILRSLALQQQGAAREAEADLQRALALAEPEDYVRIFIDEGASLADLLRRLTRHPSGTAESGGYSAAYVAMLLAAFGEEAGAGASSSAGPSAPGRAVTASPPGHADADVAGQLPALIEPLSARELEVLRLMAEGLTNEQIAARLIIALGTVKAHIHNISGKLGAQNRAHAVARARELGLL
jgi:LuxR family maltose regulon positive regulatory protein